VNTHTQKKNTTIFLTIDNTTTMLSISNLVNHRPYDLVNHLLILFKEELLLADEQRNKKYKRA